MLIAKLTGTKKGKGNELRVMHRDVTYTIEIMTDLLILKAK